MYENFISWKDKESCISFLSSNSIPKIMHLLKNFFTENNTLSVSYTNFFTGSVISSINFNDLSSLICSVFSSCLLSLTPQCKFNTTSTICFFAGS